MRVDKGSSVTVIILFMNMKEWGGNQCHKHCGNRGPGAESSVHCLTFSCAADRQVNRKALLEAP